MAKKAAAKDTLATQIEASDAVLDRLAQVVVSVNRMSEVTGLDRRTVKGSVADVPVAFTRKPRGDYRRFLDCLRACFEHRKGMGGAEQWRTESALKVRVERLILEKKYRPVEELRDACAKIGALVVRAVEGSELSGDDQEALADAIGEAVAEFMPEGGSA
jgi:hypothetical protein